MPFPPAERNGTRVQGPAGRHSCRRGLPESSSLKLIHCPGRYDWRDRLVFLYGLRGSPALVYGCAAIEYLAAWWRYGYPGAHRRRARGVAAVSHSMALEGLRYIRRNKMILGAISLDLFAACRAAPVALLPVYAREILKIGAHPVSVFCGARPAGSVIMAGGGARPSRCMRRLIMRWCVCGFGVFTVVFGLSLNVALSWRLWRVSAPVTC